MVDHTNLTLTTTQEEIKALCQEAIFCHFKTVCVRSSMVSLASHFLKNTPVLVCSVVGFPTIKTKTCDEMVRDLDQYTTESKVKEVISALREGASEIDMVIDLKALKKKEYHLVEEDIRAVVEAAASAKRKSHLVKVIIETCYLSEEEKVIACKIAECAGAHFVKTSTGYGTHGATLQDMELMSKVVGEKVGIKASGGVQTIEFATQLYNASQLIRPHEFRIGSSKLKEAFY